VAPPVCVFPLLGGWVAGDDGQDYTVHGSGSDGAVPFRARGRRSGFAGRGPPRLGDLHRPRHVARHHKEVPGLFCRRGWAQRRGSKRRRAGPASVVYSARV